MLKETIRFCETVGLLRDLKNTLGLDIAASICGFVLQSRVGELLEFCRENQEYHVISVMNGVYLNRYVPGATAFYVGDGDPNPKLKHKFPFSYEELEFYLHD